MATMGSLVVVLEANIARFQANMAQARQDTGAAMEGMQGAADLVVGALAAVGIALSVDALVGAANEAIDALAALDDMAQKTGSSVENLSRLQQLASATGADFGAVDGALVKLSKGLVSVDDEGSKVRKALTALGMSTKDLKNQDPSATFIEISKRLQNYGDGAGKVALINDALGKSGADLLPYMNDVSDHLDRFKGVSSDAAAAAANYQDQLGFLRTKHQALVTQIVSDALPAMTDFVEAFADLKSGAEDLYGVDVATWSDDLAVGLARVVDVAVLIPRILQTAAGSFKSVYSDIKVVASAAKNLNLNGVIINGVQGKSSWDEFQKDLDERNKIVEAANQDLDDLWNKPANLMEQSVLGRIAKRKETGAKPKDQEPQEPQNVLNYAGEKELEAAAARAKKLLDMRLKDLEEGLAKQQSALEFGNKYIAELRSQDLIDLDTYNDYQQKALESGLAITLRAYDAEIAALRAHQARTSKESEREDDQQAIINLQAKKAMAQQDADQDAAMLRLGLSKAQSDLNQVMKDWNLQQSQSISQIQFENTLYGKSALESAKLTAQRHIELDIEEKIRQAREKGSISDDSIQQFRQDGKSQVAQVNKASAQSVAQQIGESLRTPEQVENEQYANRLKDLQAFRDAELENTVEGNRLIEEENERHELAMLEMKSSYQMQSLGAAGNAADQLYGLMQQAGKEQSALGKAAFLASKAIAVAEILLNTEVAAAKAGAQLGIFGIPMATMIRVTGYASAGMVAGMAIAGMREKGGPVWSGGAFIVGEKGPEIFQPSSHGTIIPNTKLGSGGASDVKWTVVNTGSPLRIKETQRVSEDEWALIVEDAVSSVAAQMADPNSKVSRGMGRNFNTTRSRG